MLAKMCCVELRVKIWLVVLSIAVTLICHWLTGIAVGASLPKTKDDFINDILSQLKGSYSGDLYSPGKLFVSILKIFLSTTRKRTLSLRDWMISGSSFFL
jgi:hypothetical protein